MTGMGALVGVALILIDATLGAMKKLRIPPLAVGIGIYLPMSATFAVVVGAVLSHWYDRRIRSAPNPERAERLRTLARLPRLRRGDRLAVRVDAAAVVRRGAVTPRLDRAHIAACRGGQDG